MYRLANFNDYILYNCTTAAAAAKSLQSCPTLCDPTDGSPLGSSVPGILQARILVWVAISVSKKCTIEKENPFNKWCWENWMLLSCFSCV